MNDRDDVPRPGDLARVKRLWEPQLSVWEALHGGPRLVDAIDRRSVVPILAINFASVGTAWALVITARGALEAVR